MIKIKNQEGKQKISFITDMPISLANAIRRSVLEIPILAIDEVEIMKNDSALFDEVLAHRIGLVPIKSDLKEQKFKLKKQGPGIVYSGDLKPSIETIDNLPIVILEEGQEIEINAYAKLGKGIEHIKYSPGLAYYKHNLDEKDLDFASIENGNINSEKDIKEKKCEEIIFNIESWGQIDCKKIFLEAINVLDKNLSELNKSIK